MLTKRLAFTLWILCIIGALAVIPYFLFFKSGMIGGSYPKLLIISIVQATLLFGAALFFSFHLLKRVDLRPFDTTYTLQNTLKYGAAAGIVIAIVVFILDKTIFHHSKLAGLHPPSWAGLCSAIYGGINEEVLMRLFFVTLVYFLLSKLFKHKKRSYLLWGAILIATIAFGFGHLGVAYALQKASHFEVLRIMLLNGLAGIIFGWLYCYQGFWAAAVAHFIADIVLHVILI